MESGNAIPVAFDLLIKGSSNNQFTQNMSIIQIKNYFFSCLRGPILLDSGWLGLLVIWPVF